MPGGVPIGYNQGSQMGIMTSYPSITQPAYGASFMTPVDYNSGYNMQKPIGYQTQNVNRFDQTY